MDFKNLKKPTSKNLLETEKAAPSPPEKELLTARVTVPLAPSEKRKIEKTASEYGLKIASLVRFLLKKHNYI